MARDLVVRIVGDTRDLEKALGRAQTQTKGFGSSLASIGKTAGLAAGAAGLGALTVGLKIGINEWKQSTKVAAQTEAVLKSTGGAANVTAKQVSDLATSLMKKSGVDDEAIASGENLLLTFSRVRNEAGKGNDIFNQTVAAALDMSTALGVDMTSASRTLGKALNDPIAGVGRLARVGVTFTQAQKDQIKALVDSGKAMDAQKIILDELNKKFAGSAEAAGKTLPGQLSILRERFNNFAGDLVAKMIPVLEQAIGWLKDHWPEIRSALQGFWQSAKPILENLGDLLAAAWPVAKKAIEIFLPTLKAAGRIIGDVVALVAALLSGDWSKAWDKAKTLVVDVLAGIVAQVKLFPTLMWNAFIGVFGPIFVEPLKKAFGTVTTWITETVKGWAETIGGLPGKIADFGKALFSTFTNFFGGAGVGGWIVERVREWAGFIADLPGKIASFAAELGTRIKGFITDTGTALKNWIDTKLDTWAGWFADLPGKIGNAVKGAAEEGKRLITDALKSIFGKLYDIAADVLGIASPSKVFAGIGRNIMLGVVEGLKSSAGALRQMVMDKIMAPIDWVKGTIGGLAGDVWQGMKGIFTGGSSAPEMLKNFARAQLASFGWDQTEWAPLEALWNQESGWNPEAVNPSSQAGGIPQALPASKMGAQAMPKALGGGGDAAAQILWGLDYIRGRYGSPSVAWGGYWGRGGWYAKGGIFDRPTIIGVGERGPEAVVPLSRGLGGVTINVNVGTVLGDEQAFVRNVAPALRSELKRIGLRNIDTGLR